MNFASPRVGVWKNKCIPLLLLRSTLLGTQAWSFHADACRHAFQSHHHHVANGYPRRHLYGCTTKALATPLQFQPIAKHYNKKALYQSHNQDRCYETIPDERDQHDDPTQLARIVFSKLANRGKSWQRLGPLIEMACSTSSNVGNFHQDHSQTLLSTSATTLVDVQQQPHLQERRKSIVDVGCDHGLLTLGLAASGCFSKVLGVDVSEPALQSGAYSLYRDFQRELEFAKSNASATATTMAGTSHRHFVASALEFRVGNGLQGLQPGEAEAICLAGMGFQTMIRILATNVSEVTSQGKHNDKDSSATMLLLDQLACKELYLQPANSKPIYLMELYDTLQDMGWCVAKEHLAEISSRCYMTTMFVRSKKTSTSETNPCISDDDLDGNSTANMVKELPGCRLLTLEPSHPMKRLYQNYVSHHVQWMKSDLAKKGKLDDDEMRWLEYATDGS